MSRQPSASLFDRGLQLERTHLAWSRTALACLADAALTARGAPRLQPPAGGFALAAALAILGAAAWWHGRTTYAARSATLRETASLAPSAWPRRIALASTAITTACALLALATLVRV